MTQIHYDIVRDKGGWCIACGKVVGPPYSLREQALSDALFISEILKKAGDEVVVTVLGNPETSH